jgi:diguanylate cyclase (GGDEF)-like protein
MDQSGIPILATLALAIVATLGYLVGRHRRTGADIVGLRSRREVRRAQRVADELERIAQGIRRNLARHRRSLSRFKQRVGGLQSREHGTTWRELCREAGEILTPTLRLTTQLAGAYDQVRQQISHLMSFTEVRTDALTGIANRRALDESLASQLALMARYQSGFSVAIFDIDHFKDVNDAQGHLHGDRVLQHVAELLDDSARETDVVGRYGGEEFVVVMPRTDLEGASIFADRFRLKVQAETALTVSAGVTSALDGDTPDSLIARADAALYRAKAAGRNRVYRHTGQQVEPIYEEAPDGGRGSVTPQ